MNHAELSAFNLTHALRAHALDLAVAAGSLLFTALGPPVDLTAPPKSGRVSRYFGFKTVSGLRF